MDSPALTSPQPLVEITARRSPAVDLKKMIGCSLDSPVKGDSTQNYAIDITGWAVGRTSRASAVEVHCGSNLVTRSRIWLPRADVADSLESGVKKASLLKRFASRLRGGTCEAWREEAKTCGFLVAVGVVGLPENFTLQISILLEDGSRVPIGSVQGNHRPLRPTFPSRFQPLLLSGLGRSGSSYLIHLLGEHPDIVTHLRYPFISRFAVHLARSFHVQSTPSSPIGEPEMQMTTHQSQIVGPLPLFCRYEDAEIYSWLRKDFVEFNARSAQKAVDAFYGEVAAQQNKTQARYFTEKGFLYPFIGNIFSELYPSGREVFLVRDFRDVACSRKEFHDRRPHEKHLSIDHHIEDTMIRARKLLDEWRTRSSRAYLVRYEDLVRQPVETLSGLFGYLGLSHDPATAEEVIRLTAKRTPELDRHRTVGQAEKTIGRWRRDLSPEAQQLCRKKFAAILQEFGYED